MNQDAALTVARTPKVLDCLVQAQGDWLWHYLTPEGRAKLVIQKLEAAYRAEEKASAETNAAAEELPLRQLH